MNSVVRPGGWWALFLLGLTYILNFVDRTILSAVGEPLRLEFGLSDTQLGLMGGLAFALTYSVLGVPAAFLSERVPRKVIIASAVMIWSVMTMLCGLATGFVSLLLLRAGVGVGESGFMPSAHALISDFFPPQRRAFALALFTTALPIGVLIAAICGGWLVHNLGWRWTFAVIGAPGLILAPLIWFTLREPARGEAEGVSAVNPAMRLSEVLRHLLSRRSAWYLVIGGSLAVVPGYAIFAFGVSYLVRAMGLGIVAATTIFGVAIAGGQIVGLLAGGRLAEWVGRRYSEGLLIVPAVTLSLGAIALLATWQQTEIVPLVILLTLGITLASAYLAPSYAALHGLMLPHMRASGMSIVLLVHALIGMGLGPPVIGLISDRVAAASYEGDMAAECRSEQPGRVEQSSPSCVRASAEGLKAALSFAALFSLVAAVQMVLAGRHYRADINWGKIQCAT
ncbi:spinster family MFS transporter [Pseudomonas chlororaphis]|uniref:spinster family MFS transporter n=1 Tax=Pseudomonas chlororaphis TaxID=587753 RepID=UPI000F490CDC|nr:MFS transporter [Pseudomonas chlororaphis]ROL89748.1 hypothetical protein BK637_11120 [Pseudomonas chlororaphis]